MPHGLAVLASAPMFVAVVGGGVMGCASALALAKRGARVVVLERAVPGAEASSAAAGILGAQAESHARGPLLGLLLRARAEYAAWSDELRRETGIDIGHRVSGVLRVARTDLDAERVAKDVAWQRADGLRAELLRGHEARSLEPEIAEDVRAAAYYPDDAQVDPPLLLRALVRAASHAGVTFRSGTTVARLLVEDGACRGVCLDDGDLTADAVVLAAGSWSSLVGGVPDVARSVKPVRGQMVLLEQRPPRAKVIVFGASTYVVPRGDGRVLCGSTMEDVGFRKEVTAGGVHAILHAALEIMPALASAQLSSTWTNFRPQTGEDRPLIGASPMPGLFLATGHHRNGILLAKVTGDGVAHAVCGA